MFQISKEEYFDKLEQFRRIAWDKLEERNFEECVKYLKNIVTYAKAAYDTTLLAKINLCLAGLHIHGRLFGDKNADYLSAKNYFKIYKNINESGGNDKLAIYAYKKMCMCYENLGKYESAIKGCKKMLLIAVLTKDTVAEIQVYDLMSNQFSITCKSRQNVLFQWRFSEMKFLPYVKLQRLRNQPEYGIFSKQAYFQGSHGKARKTVFKDE